MKKSLVLLLFISFSVGLSGAEKSLDELLKQLDREVLMSRHYDTQRGKKIDSVRNELNYVAPEELKLRYDLSSKMVSLYYKFDYDSTMLYIRNMLSLVNRIGDKAQINNTTLQMASLLVSGGIFTSAIEELSKIDKRDLDTAQLQLYYSIYSSSNYWQAQFINDNDYSIKYKTIANLYRDSLLRVCDKRSDDYIVARSSLAVHRFSDYKKAFELLKPVCERGDSEDPEFAKIANTMAMLYGKHHDFENQKRMLAMAAICNIRNSTKETTAILDLSHILFKEGDLDRAHRYVKQAWDEATSYNARHRKVQISTILPLIETERLIQERQQKRRVVTYLIVISVLALLTVASLIALYRELAKTNQSKKIVESANQQLAALNSRLNEANRIKDKYLIDFFDVCTDYITKMGRWQVVIRKKLKEKRHEELSQMLDPSVVDSERQDLFRTFDTIFLSLFPTFIEEFNSLLEPDSRIVPKKNELLNRELRIFSLVRLGITDTVHISKFLDCTVTTVYTYRTKIKSKAINQDRSEFEKDIMKIGIAHEK